ncbi:Pseudoazurin precursor [Pseudoruegeria aquimaris]|uniref:Pseudoazurin n=1 Tax=Pseudoruegeria aquimaris TaxID=393663 RepID=A0A1Y5RNU1_9RHOB|nr:pseudoazurin [Pseudoruegeria aquimaris]SLN21998.1 Pseudoazurin precursor [Pseudoruegeria aquimaris]
MFKPLALGAVIAAALAGAVSAETFEVKMLNKGDAGKMIFEPDALRIAPGDTVKFIPTDKGHNAELIKGMAPEGAAEFKGKINEEIDVTFDVEGAYGVMCKPHYAMGMVMTVVVGDGPVDVEAFLGGRIPKKAKERFEAQLATLN